jgi:hypothetical protein
MQVMLKELMAKLGGYLCMPGGQSQTPLYTRLFNNQFHWLRLGKCEVFPFPCAFVEVLNPTAFIRAGQGYDTADLTLRIHLAHEYYNGDSFEQDLQILQLRDDVIGLLSNYQPAQCGSLAFVAETRDYDHDNLVIYQLDFQAHYVQQSIFNNKQTHTVALGLNVVPAQNL